MAKKLVDVEDLLVWAADELSRRPTSGAPTRSLDASRGDRELVGRWLSPPGFPTMHPMWAGGFGKGSSRGDPPHADALIVEAALARLALIAPPCSITEAELAAGLGFAVDVAGALRAAFANAANLVLVHGKLTSRPLVRLEPPEPSPKLATNGRPGVWRLETFLEPTFGDRADSSRNVEAPCAPIRKDRYPDGAYGRLEWTPDPQELANERAEYSAWRAALDWLAAELIDALETRAPLPPRAALRPWLGEADGAPIADLFAPGAEGVHSGAEAIGLAGERQASRRRPVAGGRIYSRRPIKPTRSAEEA